MADLLDRLGEQLQLAEQRHYGGAAPATRRRRLTRHRGLLIVVAALDVATPAIALVSPRSPTVGRPGIDEPMVPPSSSPVSSKAKAALAILRREQTVADRTVATPLLKALGHPLGGVQLEAIRALSAQWILAPAELLDTGRGTTSDQLCITNGEAIACSKAADVNTIGLGVSGANADTTKLAGLVPDRVATIRFVTTDGTTVKVSAHNNFYSLSVDETMPRRMIPAPKASTYNGPATIPSPPTPIGGTLDWLDARGRIIGPQRER